MANTVEMTPEAKAPRRQVRLSAKLKDSCAWLRQRKSVLSSQQNLRELKLPMPSLLVNHTQSQVLKTAACSKRMIVIYKKGSSFEIGRIKRLTDTGAFVYYSRGDGCQDTI